MSSNRSQAIRTSAIIVISISLVVIVTWFAPALSAASLNLLFRLRGAIDAPDDVVIVAIDDASLRRIGKWPWPRSLMARALDSITQGRPRAVGLDVIYAEASNPAEDRRLAEAIARNGRVVLPAQLYEPASSAPGTVDAPAAAWLRPPPELAGAARSLGHAHVSPGVDGMARAIQLSKADDRAERLWAFGLEVVRAADRISSGDQEQKPGLLRVGPYHIPVNDEAADSNIPGVSIVRQNETIINFAGPAGSFPYLSIADVIDGRTPPSTFTDKIVLVGAAAQSLRDVQVVPFMHYADGRREGGQEMPGVEIHANVINTIRGRLSLRAVPEWPAFAAALFVILCATLAIRLFDGWSQMIALGLILAAIVAGSIIAFNLYLLVPPLIPMLTGYAVVIPLLLNRSLAASRLLDLKLASLIGSQQSFASAGQDAILPHNRSRMDLPRSLTWKLRAVDDLTTRLLARMSFIDRILSSMGEGVMVADLSGRIAFANRQALKAFGCGEEETIGEYFDEFLVERGGLDKLQLREALTGVIEGGGAQLEFEVRSVEPRYCSLLLSTLTTGAARGENGRTGWHPVSRSSGTIGVVALISDITRRVELDRMKNETLQLVSHELRTPLTSIRGLSDVLLKFKVEAEESEEMLRTIHAEAVRLGETINRYLDLTRLESGAQPLHLTAVSCGELIDCCIRDLSMFAAERRIRLIARVSSSMPLLQAEAQLLAQAINNLLSNAIKYSPPETEVVIAAEVGQAGVTISVRDQGFGIPEEARDRIFEKFYRLERDSASSIVGTGLGLPLAKEIVERHGGRLTFESAPATGSVFSVYLPLQVQPIAVAAQR
jgi:PAS domain S-box-containing protein